MSLISFGVFCYHLFGSDVGIAGSGEISPHPRWLRCCDPMIYSPQMTNGSQAFHAIAKRHNVYLHGLNIKRKPEQDDQHDNVFYFKKCS